ncbi:hypothetical protein, partial [Rhodococcus sp. EPR-279]|uniref:hypothetical protein n=1 Tax=Rhodococcus sp. EPR-279 TaxID=1813678 RepID=UPI000AE3F695
MTSAPVRSPVPALVQRVLEMGIEIDDSSRRLAEYSYDASNYRIPPAAVVFPRSADEVASVMMLCGAAGVAV